jgi:hypothetical protein
VKVEERRGEDRREDRIGQRRGEERGEEAAGVFSRAPGGSAQSVCAPSPLSQAHPPGWREELEQIGDETKKKNKTC